MTLKIYDTLTRKKKVFEPIQPGKISMYACGITTYDLCHIGHGMQAIVYDVIRSYFQFKGFEVNYVRNYTDVDDKIILRANEIGIAPLELSANMIQKCEDDLAKLGVVPADVQPKVSQYIPEIIALIESLIDSNHAYESAGDVYFKVESFGRYGCLSNRKVDDMLAGARIEINQQKRNPLDFVLWKSTKKGEVYWESPWGNGRPGWHIECSAMSSAILGQTFDIHGGGKDLIFPHHENEIAQSCAGNDSEFARYWIHNGLVTVGGRKMSKSFDNFLTIQDALKEYHPDTIRYTILSHHYSANIDFSEQTFYTAYQRLIYLYTILQHVHQLEEKFPELQVQPSATLLQEFEQAMDDDLNTANAMGILSNAFKQFNDLLTSKGKLKSKANELLSLGQAIKACLKVFRFRVEEPQTALEEINNYLIQARNISPQKVDEIIAKRAEYRQNKDFEKADEMRETLIQMGVAIMDGPEGTTWQVQP